MMMLPIPTLSDADVAFGDISALPKWDNIPEQFRRFGGTKFNEIVSALFFRGGSLYDFGLTPKDGVDVAKAMRCIRACLGSFEPKHEHKEAGVAYMLSEWFDLQASK